MWYLINSCYLIIITFKIYASRNKWNSVTV